MSSRKSFIEECTATTAIALVCAGFFAFEALEQDRRAGDGFVKALQDIQPRVLESLGANRLGLILEGELWRLIAAAFLHGSIWHLVMNLWIFLDLGRVCEPLLGRERFVTSYLVAAVGASGASALYQWHRGVEAVSVGASGAILGLLGVLLAYGLRHRLRMLVGSMLRAVVGIAIITTVLPHLMGVRVDHAGHVGGFLAGAALGALHPRPVDSAAAARWRIPFWISTIVAGICLARAFWERFQ